MSAGFDLAGPLSFDQVFIRQPVLKIHQTTLRQTSMKISVMPRLTPTATSETP